MNTRADRSTQLRLVLAVAAAVLLTGRGSGRLGVLAQSGCSSNPIVCENQQSAGVTPQSQWDVAGSGDASIQGFATDISVNKGGTVIFKIATDATVFNIDIYRLGYYGGSGARKIKTLGPFAAQNWTN